MRMLLIAAVVVGTGPVAHAWQLSDFIGSTPAQQAPAEQAPAPQAPPAVQDPPIVASDAKQFFSPEYDREYTKQITPGIEAEIRATTLHYSGRFMTGTLTQANGNHVQFDPDRIADTVFDPSLVPLVRDFAAQVKRLDRQYMNGNPDVIVDQDGAKWRAVPSS